MFIRFISRFGGDLEQRPFSGVGLVFDGCLDQVPQHIAVVGTIQKLGVPVRFAFVDDEGMGIAMSGSLIDGEEANAVDNDVPAIDERLIALEHSFFGESCCIAGG